MASIPGLVHRPLNRFSDTRGFFSELYKQSVFAAELPSDFTVKQINHSRSISGVIRGIHAEPWHKLITIVRGEIIAGIVDLRPGHEGVFCARIREGEMLFVPKGCGNSFQALEETDYLYAVGAEWQAGVVYPAISLTYAPELGITYEGSPDFLDLETKGLVSNKDINAASPREARELMATLL